LKPSAALPGLALMVIALFVVPYDNIDGLPGWGRVLGWGIPSVLIVAAFLQVARPKSPPLRFIVLLGDASYALYLTHTFVILVYGKLLQGGPISSLPQIAVVPFVIAICIGGGLLAHLLVEKPLLNLIRLLSSRQSSHRAPSSPELQKSLS
jgi:peptidoglycan/LPS O-acetylase OafA/YrhL